VLCPELAAGEHADPGDIATWAIELFNQARVDRVVAADEGNRDCRCCCFRRQCGWRCSGEDDRRWTGYQIGRPAFPFR
jgi:hypothetical protein